MQHYFSLRARMAKDATSITPLLVLAALAAVTVVGMFIDVS